MDAPFEKVNPLTNELLIKRQLLLVVSSAIPMPVNPPLTIRYLRSIGALQDYGVRNDDLIGEHVNAVGDQDGFRVRGLVHRLLDVRGRVGPGIVGNAGGRAKGSGCYHISICGTCHAVVPRLQERRSRHNKTANDFDG